jgi:hypothetical protein
MEVKFGMSNKRKKEKLISVEMKFFRRTVKDAYFLIAKEMKKFWKS